MVVVTESRRKDSLNFKTERKVMHLHDKGIAYKDIRLKLGKHPGKTLVATTVRVFDDNGFGQRKFYFHRSGRKAWKMTSEVKKFLLQKVLVLRQRVVCTSVTLQQVLAREKGVDLDA